MRPQALMEHLNSQSACGLAWVQDHQLWERDATALKIAILTAKTNNNNNNGFKLHSASKDVIGDPKTVHRKCDICISSLSLSYNMIL